MKEQHFDIYEEMRDIPGLPTVLYGEDSPNLIIYIHGEKGTKEDAKQFAVVATMLGYQVIATDLSGHGENKVEFPCRLADKCFDVNLIRYYIEDRWKNIYFRTEDFGAYLALKEFSGSNVKGAMFCNPTMPASANEPELLDLWTCPVSVYTSEKNYKAPNYLNHLIVRNFTVDEDESVEGINSMFAFWERMQLENWREERDIKMLSDEENILLCAIRYACGRQTYIPSVVIGYITPKIKGLGDNALHIIDRDLVKRRSYSGGMGNDKIDRPDWIKFHDAVRDELKARGETVEELNQGNLI